MKNRDVRNKIILSLQSDRPLDDRTLAAAKAEMRARKTPAPRKGWRYALIACAAIAVCLAIVLPLALTAHPSDNGPQYASMQDYLDANGIPLKTFAWYDAAKPTVPSWAENKRYQTTGHDVVYANGTPSYVWESYSFGEDQIVCYVVLSQDPSIVGLLLGDDADLDRQTTLQDVAFDYTFDSTSGHGKATVIINGYRVIFDVQCDFEQQMTHHLEIFTISSKK